MAPKSPKKAPLKIHNCSEDGCEASFATKYKLQVHIRTHKGERPYACDVHDCEKSYTNPSHLKRHKIVSHNPNPFEQILCEHPGCGLSLANKYSLKKHYNRKHNPKTKYPFNCKQCEQGFQRKKQLQQHSYVHTGEAYFKCDKCTMSFVSHLAFTKHKRRHRTYSCECGKVFERWSLLLSHRRKTHQRQFTCEICNKSFTQASNLKQHLLVHSDDFERKLFFCSYNDCHRFYTYKKNLDQHVNGFHKKTQKPLKLSCTHSGCHVILSTERSLKQHLFRHMELRKKKKVRKVRRDKGKPKKSMATILTKGAISQELDESDNQETSEPSTMITQDVTVVLHRIVVDQEVIESVDTVNPQEVTKAVHSTVGDQKVTEPVGGSVDQQKVVEVVDAIVGNQGIIETVNTEADHSIVGDQEVIEPIVVNQQKVIETVQNTIGDQEVTEPVGGSVDQQKVVEDVDAIVGNQGIIETVNTEADHSIVGDQEVIEPIVVNQQKVIETVQKTIGDQKVTEPVGGSVDQQKVVEEVDAIVGNQGIIETVNTEADHSIVGDQEVIEPIVVNQQKVIETVQKTIRDQEETEPVDAVLDQQEFVEVIDGIVGNQGIIETVNTVNQHVVAGKFEAADVLILSQCDLVLKQLEEKISDKPNVKKNLQACS